MAGGGAMRRGGGGDGRKMIATRGEHELTCPTTPDWRDRVMRHDVLTTSRANAGGPSLMTPTPRFWTKAAAASALALLGGFDSVSAQQSLGSVACVASELEALASSGPFRRVIQRDTEVVYRVGVSLAEQEQVERGLREELATSGEIRCSWSQPEHSHLVVVGYKGVVRQDMTIDPEDPRYQSFSVGYGRSWEEAERSATTLNDRFATNYDGDGYEKLVREAWGVARSPANLADEEICSGVYSADGCWMAITNRPGCYLRNPFPVDNETVGWSGQCSDGFAHGSGEVTWYENGAVSQTVSGRKRRGESGGFTVIRDADGSRSEGAFVDDSPHGVWTYFDQDGQKMFTIGYLVPGGGTASGRLSASDAVRDNGAHYDTWTVTAIAGQRLVITMESGELDAYLLLEGQDGAFIAQDDDGGSGSNARIDTRVPEAGQYRVIASSYGSSETGTYRIWIEG